MVDGMRRCRFLLMAGLALAVSSITVAEMPSWKLTRLENEPATGWRDTLEDGWRESKATGLPMVIFITSENCVYCDAMEKRTWCDEEIRTQLGGRFIPVRLIAGRNSETLSRVSVKVYPTTLLATPEGEVVAHRKGFQPPDRIRQWLGSAPLPRRATH